MKPGTVSAVYELVQAPQQTRSGSEGDFTGVELYCAPRGCNVVRFAAKLEEDDPGKPPKTGPRHVRCVWW